MVNLLLLVDFVSTFTKVVVVDLYAVEVIGRVRTLSTLAEDLTIGSREALLIIRNKLAISDSQVKEGLASSSASGGLHIESIGFVPELSSEAVTCAASSSA